MQSRTFKTLRETETWAKEFAAEFKRPAVVLLEGDLGAGKTQLVRWFVEELGGGTAAHSPTFAIHQVYPSKSGDIDHLDLYRLEDFQDLESTGFWDLLKQDQALIFVEWASRLPSHIWPRGWAVVTIEILKGAGAEEREVSWK